MTDKVELSAIWLENPIPVTRKTGLHKRVSRITEGDVVWVKEGVLSKEGVMHKILCCSGNLFGGECELLLLEIKTNTLKTIQI